MTFVHCAAVADIIWGFIILEKCHVQNLLLFDFTYCHKKNHNIHALGMNNLFAW